MIEDKQETPVSPVSMKICIVIELSACKYLVSSHMHSIDADMCSTAAHIVSSSLAQASAEPDSQHCKINVDNEHRTKVSLCLASGAKARSGSNESLQPEVQESMELPASHRRPRRPRKVVAESTAGSKSAQKMEATAAIPTRTRQEQFGQLQGCDGNCGVRK